MAKSIHRGETKLIRIKSPNADRPVTELSNVKVRLKQGLRVTTNGALQMAYSGTVPAVIGTTFFYRDLS